jgi:hypothetical protein
MTNPKSNQIKEIIFSGKASKKITELIKKYHLITFEELNLEKLIMQKTDEEIKIFFNDLPEKKLSEIIKDLSEKKIKEPYLAEKIQQELGIQIGIAKAIAIDIIKDVLPLGKETEVEKDEPIIMDFAGKSFLDIAFTKPKEKKIENNNKSLEPDSYREPTK